MQQAPPRVFLRSALTALMAAFPVYRTYVDAHRATREDQAVLAHAIQQARDKCPECGPGMDHVARLLLSALPAPESDPWPVTRVADHESPATGHESPDAGRDARRYFLMRFQQFPGPAMAKGFEDTLLYVYNRFVSLNEVGGDPNTFGLALEEFHRFHAVRARDWPHAMNATSTHDSKRSEGVRARLNVLSEMPERWRQAVTRWARMNERHKQRCDGALAPDRNDEYLLYQTLVGALPFEVSDPSESDPWPVTRGPSHESRVTSHGPRNPGHGSGRLCPAGQGLHGQGDSRGPDPQQLGAAQ
ncbi:MAG: hypothetical protein FJ280_07540 [Planctomycetes bacterium]|nr:hypothetical protein [Planctomycetota bacterium]